MVKTETTRVWHSDGSCTDIITRTTEVQGLFGTHTHREVHKVHHTKEELEAQAKASLVVGGALVIGGLVVAGLNALFGDDDSKKAPTTHSTHHRHSW